MKNDRETMLREKSVLKKSYRVKMGMHGNETTDRETVIQNLGRKGAGRIQRAGDHADLESDRNKPSYH